MKLPLSATLALLLIAFGAASQASASPIVVFNNLNSNTSGNEQIGHSNLDFGYGPLADSFTTGGSALNLLSVTLKLEAYYPYTNGGVDVQLYSSTGGQTPAPNALLGTVGTIAGNAISGNGASLAQYGTFTVSPSSLLSLEANTQYWIELQLSSPTAGVATGPYLFWAYSNDQNVTGITGQNTYQIIEDYTPQSLPDTGYAYQMELTADQIPSTPVPESGTLVLLSTGLAAALWLERKRIFAA